jgi:chromosome segregation ATPase
MMGIDYRMSVNGNNPRLDRIEKLIEQSERANKEAHARNEQAHARNEQAHARHEREMDEIRAEDRKIREIARRTREDMRRWATLGVKEARNHRRKIAALEAKSAEYQARTDQNLAEISDKLNGLIGRVGQAITIDSGHS